MAAVALARQFLSARTTPAHFTILQRTLQFNSLFTRAASTVAAGKAAPKSGTKSKTAVAAKPGPKPKATATKGSTGKTTAKPAVKKTAIAKKTTAAKKPVATKKTTAAKKPAVKKKPVAKKKPAVKKKPAAKKKPAVKKKVVAKKKKKPELTDKQKQRKLLIELRQRALDPPTRRSNNGFMFWYKQQEGKNVADCGTIWNNFPQETKDVSNHHSFSASLAILTMIPGVREGCQGRWHKVSPRSRKGLRRLGSLPFCRYHPHRQQCTPAPTPYRYR